MSHARPELLSPAGTLRHMRYAYAYGADAVYAGQPRYSLRARNNEFDLATLAKGITEAHTLGKKLFVASNLLPHDNKVKTYLRDMAPVIALKPDALIMADPGLIMLVRERWPEVPIHLSVQANTLNSAAVRFWQTMGLSRVILSRELSLKEIEHIRQSCPDMELEVFVHGSLCIAYSGRCLLSGYFNHRDPNQGTCTNSCRWKYGIAEGAEDSSGDMIDKSALLNSQASCGDTPRHPLANQVYMLREEHRPDEPMPVFEDEHGTYIMNSKDLRAVEHVQKLTEIGINSLKIEGRTKSYYYAARTAQIYRQAINDAVAGQPFNPQAITALAGLAHRGYTDGFYQRHQSHEQQNYAQSHSQNSQQRFVGEVTAYDSSTGMAHIEVKNRFAVGNELELIQPTGNRRFVLQEMCDSVHQLPMEVAPGGGHKVMIRTPMPAESHALLAIYL